MNNEKINLAERLSYYSQTADFKASKKWALEWLSKYNPSEAKRLKNVKEYRFSNRGFVCKILEDGYDLGKPMDDELMAFFANIDTTPVIEPEVEEKQEKSSAVKKINPVISKIEDAIDAIISDKDYSMIDQPFLSTDKKDYETAQDWIETKLVEIDEMVSKYSTIYRILNKCKDRCESIANPEKKVVKSAKTTSGRFDKLEEKKKAVNSVKYLKTDSETGIVSISPAKIVGAQGLIAYDTRYRKIQVILAKEGGLEISGTSVKNFDPDTSFSFRGKKFIDFVKSKKNLWDGSLWKSVKKSTVCSRLSERILLIAVK